MSSVRSAGACLVPCSAPSMSLKFFDSCRRTLTHGAIDSSLSQPHISQCQWVPRHSQHQRRHQQSRLQHQLRCPIMIMHMRQQQFLSQIHNEPILEAHDAILFNLLYTLPIPAHFPLTKYPSSCVEDTTGNSESGSQSWLFISKFTHKFTS